MSKPLVSVVVPCFNAAETVAETIASISAQTVTDFEIIAVDNNSTDATLQVLAEIRSTEPRLRIIQQTVKGASAARNAGIKAAGGKFIALLDADDLWDPDYLAAHLANLADPRIGISYAKVRLIDVNGRPTGAVTQPKLHGLRPADMLRSNPCTILIVVRTDVFRSVGPFDENLPTVEDQEWLFRASVNGIVLQGINRTLSSYRIMPGGLSADLDEMLKCNARLLEAAARLAPALVARERRLARAGMLRYCARRAIEHGQSPRRAWGYLARMFAIAPDLLLREPLTTAKVVLRIMLPGLRSNPPKQRRAAVATAAVLQTGDN